MSSKAYQEAYRNMTKKQKDIMHDLYMKAVNHDGHSWNMFCDIEDAVAGIVKAQQWIPCSTALPSKYDNYLITTEDGMVVFGVYDPREKQWCRYDSIKSWWLYGIKVLAWIPLPKPYCEDARK